MQEDKTLVSLPVTAALRLQEHSHLCAESINKQVQQVGDT
jgi:hypothetical protein